MAEGTLDVGGNTLLVWVHGERVGPFMNGLHFFFGVGAFLSPIIVAQVMSASDGIVWTYWALTLLIVPIIGWLLRLRSPEMQAAAGGAATGEAKALLVILIALFFFLCVGAESSVGGWVFSYVTELGLQSETTAAYLNSAFWGALTLGRLLAIPVAARVRPSSILVGDLLTCLAGAGIILLWPSSAVAVWLGVIGVGLSIGPLFATTMSLAERLMPITGKVTGWFFVGVGAGGMVVPWLIGQLFESVGPQVMVWAILIDAMVAIGVFSALMLLSRRQP
jgi:fucose permease